MKIDPSLALAFRWACPQLLKPGVIKRIHDSYGKHDFYTQLNTLGVLTYDDIEKDDVDCIIAKMRLGLKNAARIDASDTIPGKNIALLAKKIGLNALEIDIVVLLVLVKQFSIMKVTDYHFGALNKTQFNHAVAALLGADIRAVEKALSTSGRLVKTSIVYFQDERVELAEKFDFVRDFDVFISDELKTTAQMMEHFIHSVETAALTISDFAHIAHELDYLLPYLKEALTKGLQGCNVLLYGAPGTGKTELAKTLARTLGVTLYEVKTAGTDNEPIYASTRLGSYNAGCHLLEPNGQHLLLFDEIEDVMSRPGDDERSVPRSKVWFNRLLEQNPIPTIWTSNQVYCIDNAYLRRFDIVLEMTAPSRQQRFKFWQRVCKAPDFQDSWLKQVSTHLPLPPSEMDRIARVVNMASSRGKSQQHARQLISHSYKAATGRTARWPVLADKHVVLPYQLSWLNSDSDIDSMVKAISQHQRGKLCLYGPPGCGKTQLAHYIAQCADMPLISKKASDLMSPYVGETEQNIAAAFKEATADQAVLLIDEADSFFADRINARASWEMTSVNELLVQLEQFEGIFIAATNLFNHFDHASKRRFDFKVELDYLTSKQCFDLYCKTLHEKPFPDALEKLLLMKNLTPGNFAVAKRQAMLLQQPITNWFLMNILQQEAVSNPNKPVNRTIGFIH
jgi:transitional endoplasmic reticulum ATPase